MLRPLTEALARRKERRSNRMYFLFTMVDNPRSVLKGKDPCARKRNLVLGRCHGTAKATNRQGLQRAKVWRRPSGGARRDRTDDLMLAKHALSQLSYGPFPGGKPQEVSQKVKSANGSVALRSPDAKMVGLGRLELPTSRLSSARSNQLSYKPQAQARPCGVAKPIRGVVLRALGHSPKRRLDRAGSSRKKEKRRRRNPAYLAISASCSKRSDRRQA